MKNGRYWDGILQEWLAEDRDALWRRYSDALHTALFRRWLGKRPGGRLLKTDLFDEAVSEGMSALGAESSLAVGVDISEEVALAARRRHPGWNVIVADVRHLPFADGAFGAILSNSTLDHFEAIGDISGALEELRRVLRPGGRLLLTLDNAANPVIALRQALPKGLLYRLGITPYAVGRTVGPNRLKAMLRALALRIVEMSPILHCPRYWAVRRARRLKNAPPLGQERFLRSLARWEILQRPPSRWLTGYFIAILAIKEGD